VIAAWSVAHPQQLAVLLCAEACSAAYAIRLDHADRGRQQPLRRRCRRHPLTGNDMLPAAEGPRILSFASYIITGAVGAMRYDWDRGQGKFSFFLDPAIP
jgi:polyketide synthase Type III